MASAFDPNIPLTLTHSFVLGAGWSVAPEVKAEWKPIVQAGPMLAPTAATVTLKLAF